MEEYRGEINSDRINLHALRYSALLIVVIKLLLHIINFICNVVSIGFASFTIFHTWDHCVLRFDVWRRALLGVFRDASLPREGLFDRQAVWGSRVQWIEGHRAHQGRQVAVFTIRRSPQLCFLKTAVDRAAPAPQWCR